MKTLLVEIEQNYTDEHCDENPVLYSSPASPGGKVRFTAEEPGEYSLKFETNGSYYPLEEEKFTLPGQDGQLYHEIKVCSEPAFGDYRFSMDTPSGKIIGLLLRVGESPASFVGFRIASGGQIIFQVMFGSTHEPVKVRVANEMAAPRQTPTLRFISCDFERSDKEIEAGETYWYPEPVLVDERNPPIETRLSLVMDPDSPPVAGNGTVGVEILVDHKDLPTT